MTDRAKYIFILALGSVACRAGQTEVVIPPPPGAEYEGRAFTFNKIREGIYHAVGTGSLVVGANSVVIVNEKDVLLVDSHMTPAAEWAMMRELDSITDKPIRYVVNTHFHFDHVHGNQVFPDDVEIIGHEFTRQMIANGKSKSGRSYDAFVGTLPDQITELKNRIDTTTDATERSELERTLAIQERYLVASNSVEPVAPTTTLARRLTLFRGDREIQLLFFGRGHTGGDVVVYLPKERVLVTGDLLTSGLSYMGDGYLAAWIETLEHLKGLDYDVILPGHGDPFEEREKIDYFQAYLRDFQRQAERMYAAGVSAEDAAKRMDMSAHAAHYPNITGPGVSLLAVQRVYELLDGTHQ
ncbi:MAG: MBL fold metallo-hydrolase [Gemmatimonadales bacterium]